MEVKEFSALLINDRKKNNLRQIRFILDIKKIF